MTITQTADYYPFGMRFSSAEYNNTADNKYLYNSKELQDDQMGATKLDWYDYGARMYDPQIGRWNSIDPLLGLSTSLTPYNFCLNNPIRYVDPNGKDVIPGGGQYGGDLYTGEDARMLYIILTSRIGKATFKKIDESNMRYLRTTVEFARAKIVDSGKQ